MAEQKIGPTAAQRFYGPQIPVPWADEPVASNGNQSGNNISNNNNSNSRKRKNKSRYGEPEDDSEGNDSPTEEVMRLLGDRSINKYNDNMDSDGRDTEYTKAFLKSRYSGSLHPKNPAALMMQPKPGDSRNPISVKPTVEEENFEYIGPQLQPDWIAESEKRELKHKNQALRMDLVPGREKKKLHQKGVAEVIKFDSRIEQVDSIGPGYYDTGSNLDMANAADKALGVPFHKAIARKDQVGAFGERPEAATEPLPGGSEGGNNNDFGDLYFDEQLDVDYGKAKDQATEYKRNKSFQLYVKVRIESEMYDV